MTKTKTIFIPVTPEMTHSQILSLFYGYQAVLLRAWGLGADPAPFFGEVLGIRTREEYVAFREELRVTLRRLGEVQAGLARRTRIPGGDPEAQTRRAQLRPLVTTLIAMRRAGKAWAGARAKSRCTQAA